MVQFAERRSSALTIGAALVLTGVGALRTGGSPAALPPAPVEAVTASEPIIATPPPAPSSCPAFITARLHLEAWTAITCIPGNYGAPGYFVDAIYTTTEAWERYGIVGNDGALIVAMSDRPVLGQSRYAAADLDGDGIDEIAAVDGDCDGFRARVMVPRGGILAVDWFALGVHRASGCGCAGPEVSIVGHEVRVRYPGEQMYRFVDGKLVERE